MTAHAAPPHRRRGRRHLALVACALYLLASCTGELTSPTEPLRLLATSLPAVFVGERVDLPLRPTGGLRPYAYAVVDGALPPGLSVSGGRLVGTPTTEGRFAFTVEISDASLNRTVQRLELLVRPLPAPELRIDAPTTDVVRSTPLRLALHDARGWRGAKVEITWDDAAFELEPESVRAASDTLSTFVDEGPGLLRVDVAALGAALDGEHELLRFSLAPRESGGPLRLTVASEHRYVGGHHYTSRREGAGGAPDRPTDPPPDLDDPPFDEPPFDDPPFDDPDPDELELDEPGEDSAGPS